jgi:hypothetical protein
MTARFARARTLLAALAGATTLALIAPATGAYATVTLDAHQENVSDTSALACGSNATYGTCGALHQNTAFAQEFTPGESGALTAVSLYLVPRSATQPLTVEVRSVDNQGVPAGVAGSLASGTVPTTASAGWNTVTFDTPLQVTAGQTLALVAATTWVTDAAWEVDGAADGTAYPDDTFWSDSTASSLDTYSWQSWSHDLAFRTYIDFNSAPSCVGQDAGTTAVNTGLPITLACSDVDTADTFTYGIATAPVHGQVTTPDSSGHTTYTPDAGYVGSDSFTFGATDNHDASSAPATVTVDVGPDHAPTCASLSVNVAHATTKSIPLSCADSDTGQTLALHIVSPPAHGTLSAISNGHVSYTPKASFGGNDSFTFRASDGFGGTSPTATVSLHVAAGDTTLTLTASTLKVPAGTAVHLRARLRDALTGGYLNNRRIYLQTRRSTASSWSTVTSTLTSTVGSSAGTALFTVKPTRSRYYRVIFTGTAAYRASHSAAVHITVT